MRRFIIYLLVLSLPVLLGLVPVKDDIASHPECQYCGMDRKKFGFSRMLIVYEDGTVVPTCSIHCTGIDLALNPHKLIRSTSVGDYDTHELLNAENAVWVLGGDRMGVMSIQGKWAFKNRSSAERFIGEHGGVISTYDGVMRAVFEDMYEILR